MPSTPGQHPLTITLVAGPAPARTQIRDAVVAHLVSGSLAPGDVLPSTRDLAQDLGVSRGVVVAAYDDLVAAGYAEARTGSGTRITPGADLAARAATAHFSTPDAPASAPEGPVKDGAPEAALLDLRAGRPETALISTTAWRRAWRQASVPAPSGRVLSEQTHPELQGALAQHLRQVRGIRVAAQEIVIVPGSTAGLTLLAAAAGLAGAGVAMEDPGYQHALRALRGLDCHVRPVAVDHDGLDPTLLQASDRAVYLTPAHQFPVGTRMPVARRAALLQRAAAEGVLVIEDDYDGEFRYGVPPLPALRSMGGAAEVVAYLGTASKVLTPDLGLAWLIAPTGQVDAIRREQYERGLHANPVAAHALAHLIDTGELTRHLARASRLYRARRDALVSALPTAVPELRVVGVEAGLHLVVELPAGIPDMVIARRLHDQGVAVGTLSGHSIATHRQGLVLGYATLPETPAPAAATALRKALAHQH